ncbi:hypothetical protein IFR05_014952 [Cadophora sp. M221]|nr:hypothetical protein IFR05_014952 [Cadophora sp. M221]
MEKSPKSVDVRELCPKCRPHTLGVGPVGKKVREHEVEVLEGNLRGGEEREEKREDNMVLKNDDGNGVGESMNCAEDDIDMKGKWMDVKPSSSSRSDTSNIPSVTNGDAETPASLSIFKRVLGAMIPGSSSYSTANREEDFKNGGGADKEEDIQESGEDKKGEGKGKGKQSWIQVDEDPNWEVVGGERK